MRTIKEDHLYVKITLITIAVIFSIVFLFMPLTVIFIEAFNKGIKGYFAALSDADSIDAIQLTAIVTCITIIANFLFGIAAAWCISKFRFVGRNILITLIDLPFSVSPVIAGLIYVILYGVRAPLGEWLATYDITIIFALPGMILTTIFVTLPFIARELIPLMEQQGSEEEEAAMLLGAKGWQVFLYITLPKIKWGLLYGVLLCSARAMGEFGAVSVVSGNIKGATNTIPLQVEILYNEYNFTAAFAVASLLTFAALITLFLKSLIEWKHEKEVITVNE